MLIGSMMRTRLMMLATSAAMLPLASSARAADATTGGTTGAESPSPTTVDVSVNPGAVIIPGDSACDCQATYSDGRVLTVSTCDDFQDSCCDVTTEDEYVDECADEVKLLSCRCSCSESYSYTYDTAIYIRGVPTFYQFIIGDAPRTCSGLTSRSLLVGCGPIAGAELVAWYDSLGWRRLGARFRNSTGHFDWYKLARELRTRMGSFCVPFSSTPDGAMMSATPLENVLSGLEGFFSDAGVTASMSYARVKQSEASTYFEIVKTYVNAHKPVLMLYCIEPSRCEGGIGITDVSLDWQHSHIALITGYVDDGDTRQVFVDGGNGSGSNGLVEWSMGNGSVRLGFVDIQSAPTVSDQCAADDLENWYLQTHDASSNIGYTCQDGGFDSFEVRTEISGSTCDLIASEETQSGVRTWGSGGHCLTPHAAEVIDESLPDLGGISDPLTPQDP